MQPQSTTRLRADLIAVDQALGLVTVRCPRCERTCGVLPGSATWHARCGVRMVPVDPESAARLQKRARERRWYRKRMESPAQNPGNKGGLEGLDEAEGVGTPWRPSAVVR